MEHERALFRVYDRSLESLRLDQPYFPQPALRHVRPSTTCRAVEWGLLSFAVLLLTKLVVLHSAFVGEGTCLHDDLVLLRQLRVSTAPPGPNRSALPASALPLLRHSDVLNLRLSDGPGSAPELRTLLDFVASNASAPQAVTFVSESGYEPDFRFSLNPPLLYLSDGFLHRHDVTMINLTLSTDCLTKGSRVLGALVGLVGWDTVIMNQVLVGVGEGGMLQSTRTQQVWSWSKAALTSASHRRTLVDACAFRVGVVFQSLLAFFFTSTVTSLMVRMLISSGVIVMFPLFFCLRRLGLNSLDMHILTLSYPWLGIPIDRLRQQRKPVSPMILAHAVRVVVLYSMYEACELAWSLWMYDKPIPDGLQLWLYGIVMVWEYYSMICLRAASAIYYLPRFTLVYFLFFHFYLYGFTYGFFEPALLLTSVLTLHAMVFCLVHMEVPASTRLEVSYDTPRALFSTLPWNAWSASLPPSWTLFLPLNERAQTIYEQQPGAGGGGNAGPGGGEPDSSSSEEEEPGTLVEMADVAGAGSGSSDSGSSGEECEDVEMGALLHTRHRRRNR